jgi:tRNA(adenine34) deaminase
LHKVVYGLRDPRSGADTLGLLRNPDLLYQVESAGGILEDICKEQFQSFFRKRRQEQKEEKTAKK